MRQELAAPVATGNILRERSIRYAEAARRSGWPSQGFEVRTSTPEQMGAYIRSELVKGAPIVREAGVKPK